MNRYEKGKICKITDGGYEKCYIGSTCEDLSKRLARHREKHRQHLRQKYRKVYVFELFDEYGVENCKIELIENYPCKSKEELLQREGHYIRSIECVNKKINGRTKKQYQEEHKEENKERCKEWARNNHEKLMQYRQDRKEQLDAYNKEWKANNKEHIRNYNEKWRHENKDKIAMKAMCNICGSMIRKYDMKWHQETRRCQSFRPSKSRVEGKVF